MKKVLCSLFLASLYFAAFAQPGDPCLRQKTPLSDEAYLKMMRSLYNFTVTGSETPTSGFKVETTTPSITLRGTAFPAHYKSVVWTFELTGGVQDGFMQVFSGKQLNPYATGTIGLNIMTPRLSKGKYERIDTLIQQTFRNIVCADRDKSLKVADSILIMAAII